MKEQIRNYPGTRVYYVRSTAGNRLATVMLMKDRDGWWCRGVALMSQEKGCGNKYDVNEGRRLAWKRLQAAVHKRSGSLPITSVHGSANEFLDLTGGRITLKSEHKVVLTPKEEAIVNATEKYKVQ